MEMGARLWELREEEGCPGLLAMDTCRPRALTSTGLLPGAAEWVQEPCQVWGQISRVTGTGEDRNSWREGGQTPSMEGWSQAGLESCGVL